jgi:hypothetical protein
MTGALVRFGRDSHPSFTDVSLNRHRHRSRGGLDRAGVFHALRRLHPATEYPQQHKARILGAGRAV